MLFEVLLMAGITLFPLSAMFLLFSAIWQQKIIRWIGFVIMAASIVLIMLSYVLPPIPIISQG